MDEPVKILIAEDQIEVMKTILLYLKIINPQYILIEAKNGEVAYQKAVAEIPDLIITDWEMPLLNGIDLILKLKENLKTSEIPVIVSTARIDSKDLQFAFNAGAVDYIRKPIERQELAARVKSVLKLSNSFKILKKQNEKIELQNKKVYDSLNYAKRIQNVLLPDSSVFAHFFSEYFLIYLPRDVVSGDFYWLYETPDYLFIILADCTGHGVPGALMSMIGIHLLNEVIIEQKIHNTAEILTELNNKVNFTLKKTENAVQDGMECIIARISTFDTDYKIDFAGAKLPLYVLKKGESKIEKIVAARKSIGSMEIENVEFFNHEITLSVGDTIFLLTDGYADQLNSSIKRFGMHQVVKTIEENAQTSMPELAEIFENKLKLWQESMFQTDDISFIGLRF